VVLSVIFHAFIPANLVVASNRDDRPKIAEAVHQLIEKKDEIVASAREDALKSGYFQHFTY
jgi:hypothetical protein